MSFTSDIKSTPGGFTWGSDFLTWAAEFRSWSQLVSQFIGDLRSFIFQEFFDELNDGELAGQNNWQSDLNQGALVGNYNPFQGTKCVKFPSAIGPSTDRDYFQFPIGPFSEGLVSFAVKKESNSGESDIFLEGVNTAYANPIFDTDNNIKLWDNNISSYVTIGTWVVDVWYYMTLQVDITNNQYRAQINNGSWSVWVGINANTENGVPDGISEFDLYNGSSAGVTYFDAITIQPTMSNDAKGSNTITLDPKH